MSNEERRGAFFATGSSELAAFLAKALGTRPDPDRLLFLCIGSDRSTGDAFGPWVGTLLKERGWPHVIGTLEEPCDAYKVEEAARIALGMQEEDWTVVAIDACLGKPTSVGGFIASAGPLRPGAATGRKLPSVGNISIAGVVNLNGPKAYGMLQTTSLYLVMNMAKQTADAIHEAWGGQG